MICRSFSLLLIVFLFACSNQEDPDNNGESGTDVVFYLEEDQFCEVINVSFSDKGTQALDGFYSVGVQPFCTTTEDPVFENVELGNHSFEAVSTLGCFWEGTVNVVNTGDCFFVLLNDDFFVDNVCDRWIPDLPCIEVSAIDSIAAPGSCFLGDIGGPTVMVPRITVRNNCDVTQKVVLCYESVVLEPTNNPDGLTPGTEDTFVSCGLDLEMFNLLAIEKQYVDQFGCRITRALCE